ncbi:DNA-damage-inducible protein D [Streptomyces sp. SPB074]|nr:DNA-damage-inducible protein D [Streptomyces sp. SPB074]
MVAESHEGEEHRDAFLALRAGDLAQAQGDLDVLGGGEDGDEAEGLEDEADAFAAQGEQAVLVEGGEVGVVDDDAAGAGGVEVPTSGPPVTFSSSSATSAGSASRPPSSAPSPRARTAATSPRTIFAAPRRRSRSVAEPLARSSTGTSPATPPTSWP